MPFDIKQLLRCRPYLYHLTAEANLQSIESTLQLRCANTLLAEAGLAHRSTTKRLEHLTISARTGNALIRDQKPLIEGAIAFEEGWALARFVEYVNKHVFFWPGLQTGPIKPGLNHFARYRAERPLILRFPTESLIEANLKFSRYNSGAPRCSGGRYSPRGSRTYLPANEFPGTASEVVEVVAVVACALPCSVEAAFNPEGPWRPLRWTSSHPDAC